MVKEKKFTVSDTNIIKGIAIIFLLFYHCFSSEQRLYNDVRFLISKEEEMWVYNAFNVCVGMFAVLSSYGITVASEKLWNKGKDSYRKYYVHRLLSLLSGFWIVYIPVLIASYYFGNISVYEESTFDAVIYGLVDFFGGAYFFNSPSLCTTWWYLSFTILVIAVLPIIDIIYDKISGVGITLLFFSCITIFQVPNTNMTKWLFAIILGHIAAKKNLFVKIDEWKLFNNQKINIIAKALVDTGVLVILIWFRQSSSGYHFYSYITHGITPFFTVYFCFRYICIIPVLKNVLYFLGKHSMNIFLIHTFYRWIWFKEYVYSFKYPIVIFVVLMIMSLLTSMVIEMFKKITKYDIGIKKLEKICYYKQNKLSDL